MPLVRPAGIDTAPATAGQAPRSARSPAQRTGQPRIVQPHAEGDGRHGWWWAARPLRSRGYLALPSASAPERTKNMKWSFTPVSSLMSSSLMIGSQAARV